MRFWLAFSGVPGMLTGMADDRTKIIEQLQRKRQKLALELDTVPAGSRRAEDIGYDLEEIDEQLARAGAAPGGGASTADPQVAELEAMGAQIQQMQRAIERGALEGDMSEYEQERLAQNAERLQRERYRLAEKVQQRLGNDAPPVVRAIIGERGTPDVMALTKGTREQLEAALRRLEALDVDLAEQQATFDRLEAAAGAERDWNFVSKKEIEALGQKVGMAESVVRYTQSKIKGELETIRGLRRALQAAGVGAELTPEMEKRLGK